MSWPQASGHAWRGAAGARAAGGPSSGRAASAAGPGHVCSSPKRLWGGTREPAPQGERGEGLPPGDAPGLWGAGRGLRAPPAALCARRAETTFFPPPRECCLRRICTGTERDPAKAPQLCGAQPCRRGLPGARLEGVWPRSCDPVPCATSSDLLGVAFSYRDILMITQNIPWLPRASCPSRDLKLHPEGLFLQRVSPRQSCTGRCSAGTGGCGGITRLSPAAEGGHSCGTAGRVQGVGTAHPSQASVGPCACARVCVRVRACVCVTEPRSRCWPRESQFSRDKGC